MNESGNSRHLQCEGNSLKMDKGRESTREDIEVGKVNDTMNGREAWKGS